MPIAPSAFPDLQPVSNGEPAQSIVFNRPSFALSTRTESLRTLLESVEGEVVDARGGYTTLQNRLDTMFGSSVNDSNIFLSGGSATWSKAGQTFTHSAIYLIQAQQSFNYSIASGSVSSIDDGDVLYVTLTRDSGDTVLTINVAAQGSVPTSINTFVIGVRHGDRLWIRGNGEFENEETREIGDGLTEAILGRLGMNDESDSASHFSNVTIISIGDNIPTAISKLDLNNEYLVRDRNTFIHGGGNVSWLVSGGDGSLTFDDDLHIKVPSVGDITIAATTVPSIADDEVLYISFLRSGSDYTKTISKSVSASLPLSNGNTDNYVLGYRSGDTFILRSGEALQNGETRLLGSGGSGLAAYQNMSLYPSSEQDVSWDATSGVVDCASDVVLHFPWTTSSNIIESANFPFMLSTSSKKAYVVLDRSNQSNLTVVSDVDTIPLDFAQPDVLLVAERLGDAVYLFGSRYNDGDIRRLGEGFTAGTIYDELYAVGAGGESTITLPDSGEHSNDNKTLKVYVNGLLNYPTIQYTETPSSTQITAQVCEDYPDGKFPEDAVIRLRMESIVTGGAGSSVGPSTGDAWSDPVDANIVPNTDDTWNLGATTKGMKGIYLSDQNGNGDIYHLYINSGSLQAVKI